MVLNSFIVSIAISISVFLFLIVGGWAYGKLNGPDPIQARRIAARGQPWVTFTPLGPPIGPPPEMTEVQMGEPEKDALGVEEWKPLSAVILPSLPTAQPSDSSPPSRHVKRVSLSILIRPPLPPPLSAAPVRTPDDHQLDDEPERDIDVELGTWHTTVEGDLLSLRT